LKTSLVGNRRQLYSALDAVDTVNVQRRTGTEMCGCFGQTVATVAKSRRPRRADAQPTVGPKADGG